MKNYRLILAVLIFSPLVVIAEDDAKDDATLAWTYVELEYLDLDLDTGTPGLNGEGETSYELDGQYALGEHLLLYGAYQLIDTEVSFRAGATNTLFTFSQERKDTRIGVGGKMEFANKVGVFVRGGYLRSRLTQGTFSTSDDGYFLSAGVRWRVFNRFELFATGNRHFDVDYLFFTANQSVTDYQFGARYDVSKRFQVGLAYRDGEFLENGTDYDGFGISGRYNFGR